MEEIWKDVDGYDGRYSISTHGRVMSNYRHHNGLLLETKILIKLQSNSRGYYCNRLYDDKSKARGHTIHRLVATAFIPNPDNLPCINHLDGDKKNNMVDNLEWCSYSRNNQHAYDLGLKKASNTEKFGINSKWSKPIIQLTKDGVYVREYDSLATLEKKTGFWKSYVCRCANFQKHCVTANGYRWIYKDDFEELFRDAI